jgi:hypothetical protein
MELSDHPRVVVVVVVVVGDGIIDSAIAMHPTERGMRPVLVDEDRAGRPRRRGRSRRSQHSATTRRLLRAGLHGLGGLVAVACAVCLDVATLASPGLLVETEPLPAFTDKVV